MRTHSNRKAALVIAIVLASFAALAETVATFGFQWITPTWLFVAIAASLTALAAWSVAPRGRAFSGAAALAGLGWFAVLYVWPMTPRKLFFRDMQRIEVGMSRADVAQLAANWRRKMPGEDPFGWELPPTGEYWFHGEGGQLLSSDRCIVSYSDERVAAVEFVFD